MKKALLTLATLVVFPLAAAAENAPLDRLDQWPGWRGPLGTGVAPRGNPPVEWAEDRNVRWKLELPGVGHSTPIIWGDLVFLTSALPYGDEVKLEAAHAPGAHDPGAHDNLPPSRRQRFLVLAVDRTSGTIRWQTTVRDERPHEGAHETGSWASASPVTDGRHLFAHFGSRGLFALDFAGKVRWEKDLGDMRVRHEHGEGSSPALHGDTLIVNWDHQGDSFLVALDKRTGKERWKVERDEITSWSTPLVVEHGDKPQVVVAATNRIRGYDLATGRVIWECGGLSRNVVASPVAGDGMVFVGNSYDWAAMLAIRLDAARGDITEGSEAVVWSRRRDTPYVPSPLLYDGMLYFLKHSQGFLTNVDAKTGEPHYGPVRLGGMRMIFASPVGAAGRLYVVDRNGTTMVIRHGAEPELLSANRLDDSFSASPAVVGGELYLRGVRHLYSIVQMDGESASRSQQ